MWNLDIPIIQTFKYTLQRFQHEFLFHFTFLKTIVACFVGPINSESENGMDSNFAKSTPQFS
jgi:hypothetical protein